MVRYRNIYVIQVSGIYLGIEYFISIYASINRTYFSKFITFFLLISSSASFYNHLISVCSTHRTNLDLH